MKAIYECLSRSNWVRIALVAALSLMPTLVNSQAIEYRLQAGDVLELTILGDRELHQNVPIEISGWASFPLIDPVQAAGLTLSELRELVQGRLSQQTMKLRGANGLEILDTIERHEITLRVSAYRPVYLTGDIVRSGEVPYRPGLTILQAVAIAGGYDILRTGEAVGIVQRLDLQNQLQQLAEAYAKDKVRLWRLEASMGNKRTLDRSELTDVPSDVLEEIFRLQQSVLDVHRRDFENQRDFLKVAIATAEQRIKALEAQVKSEEAGSKMDEEELERVSELARRSVVPVTRVTEVRRAALLASSRALQTGVALETARRDREELRSRLQRLEDSRRVEVLREMDEASARVALLRTQLQGIRQKLAVLASSRNNVLQGSGTRVDLIVIRREAQGTIRLSSSEDTQLLPGDTVEVAVKTMSTGVPFAHGSQDAPPKFP